MVVRFFSFSLCNLGCCKSSNLHNTNNSNGCPYPLWAITFETISKDFKSFGRSWWLRGKNSKMDNKIDSKWLVARVWIFIFFFFFFFFPRATLIIRLVDGYCITLLWKTIDRSCYCGEYLMAHSWSHVTRKEIFSNICVLTL